MSVITLFGASGAVGRAIAAELVKRGHTVRGVSRAPAAIPPGVVALEGDATDADQVAEIAAGSDVIASAVGPRHDGADDVESLSAVATGLVEGARRSMVKRLVIVGGAGSLIESDGARHVDTPHFMTQYLPVARAHSRALDEVYSQAGDLDWTYVSPAEVLFPGEATGSFRVGDHHLVRDAAGEHRISIGDYAIGFADAIEDPGAFRRQISLAY